MRTRYLPGPCRDLLFVGLILAMSYAVAFMETLTIAHFPYYDFEDRDMAYTVVPLTLPLTLTRTLLTLTLTLTL